MDQTPNLSLPYIMAAQAQKHVTHNEAIRALDAIVQLAALDRDLATPPAGPSDGDRYIVAPGATGVWAGKAGQIAAFQDGAWAFFVPRRGWVAWVVDENVLVAWDGSMWTVSGGGGGAINPPPLVGVNATADTASRLAVSSPNTLFNHEGADHRVKINKAAANNTASVLFQDGFSGRAETGLTGDDDFHVKVSADGSTWREAIVVDRNTGAVAMPFTAFDARENLLINGDFQINQRGFGGGALTAGVYGFDRWKAETGGATLTRAGYVVTLSAGAIVQVVEPAMAGLASFASTPLTLSVEAPSADLTITAGSVSGTLTAGTGRRSITLTPAAGDTGNLRVKIAKATAGSVTFGRVKLELGAVPSPWQARPLPQELSLCQRYFQATVPFGQNPATYAPGAGNGSIYAIASASEGSVTVVRLPAPMRTTPTVTVRDGAASAGKISVYNGAWVNNFSFTGVLGLTDKGFSLQQNNVGVFNVSFDYTADAEL